MKVWSVIVTNNRPVVIELLPFIKISEKQILVKCEAVDYVITEKLLYTNSLFFFLTYSAWEYKIK